MDFSFAASWLRVRNQGGCRRGLGGFYEGDEGDGEGFFLAVDAGADEETARLVCFGGGGIKGAEEFDFRTGLGFGGCGGKVRVGGFDGEEFERGSGFGAEEGGEGSFFGGGQDTEVEGGRFGFDRAEDLGRDGDLIQVMDGRVVLHTLNLQCAGKGTSRKSRGI